VTDVIADPDMTEETRADMKELTDAGFENVRIEETHRVHDQAASAIVKATMPS